MVADDAAIETLRRMIAEAHSIVGFTGAGLSTECGVPDFRSPGSPWTRNKPIPFSAFLANQEARNEGWRRKFTMDALYRDARPGRGHRAFAALIAAGRMSAVITQNIDNLHQTSGIPDERIIELHGNGSYATCLSCAKRYELDWVRESFEADGRAPDCPACSGFIKSATISFGQAMPKLEVARAYEATMAADLFLCVGSSLVVYPAATYPEMAARAGISLVIINAQPTALDPLADLLINDDIGTVLEQAVLENAVLEKAMLVTGPPTRAKP